MNARVIMDGFAGAGGNVIAYAKHQKVIAIDLDSRKLDMLKNNAQIYGVLDNIQFVEGNFLEVAENYGPVDILFMSPPWGGPNYVQQDRYNIFRMMHPDIKQICNVVNRITKGLILYLPRNLDPMQICALFKFMPNIDRRIEFQLYYFGNKVKAIGCFFGETTELDVQNAYELLKAYTDEKGIKVPKTNWKLAKEALKKGSFYNSLSCLWDIDT